MPIAETDTEDMIDNTHQHYRRKYFIFLNLQEKKHQQRYDSEKSLKLFKYLTDDVGRENEIPIPDRRKADLELRKEFEQGEWLEIAESEHPERYNKVFKGWHTVRHTPYTDKKLADDYAKSQVYTHAKPVETRVRKASDGYYNIQAKYHNPIIREFSKGVSLQKNELSKHGWSKRANEQERHKALRASSKEDGYSTTRQRLQFLENVTSDKATKAIAREDGQWLSANQDELKQLKPTMKKWRVYLQQRHNGRIKKKSGFYNGHTSKEAMKKAEINNPTYNATRATTLIHPKPSRRVSR